jgi:D-amino peptidase
MAEIKAVYVVTDLEGVAGIDDWDPRHRKDAASARGVHDRSEMQRLLTGEVNATAQGLLAAGVEEILINDSHGAGRTILPEQLMPGVKVFRGVDRPRSLPALDGHFDALVQIGMHAMADTPNACLCHSMSRGYIYRINGAEVGEMEIAAYLAGEMGIPWIFTAGDGHACREAISFVPNMITAPVKEGLGLTCALHLTPHDARALIKERIQRAVENATQIEPLVVQDKPVVMEVQRETPWPAEIRPGTERIDAFTLRCEGDSFWQVAHQYFYNKPDLGLPT